MFADTTDQSNPWNWPRYNPPGLLIGPILYKKSKKYWVPSYTNDRVRERIAVEIDFAEDMCYEKGKL